ncbi:MAG: hypothetical protein M3N56_10485, partial [Actinomycetota bacterium]|nr:hypothetical protein [Actinomycetota bacterium]
MSNGTELEVVEEPEDKGSEVMLAGFSTGGAVAQVDGRDAGALQGVARERFEIEAMVSMAIARPRDDLRAYQKIIQSAKRPGFAAMSVYRFPRGGSSVSGPSVKLARPLAAMWGNMRSGFSVVTIDDDW